MGPIATTAITHIRTPFKENFGIPRQSLLIPEAWGEMSFPKNDFFMEAFRGIEEFSHLWLIFSFHQAVAEGVKALIRPPRFQGKEKWGVFATRSPHRPNHLGMSVVEFKSLEVLTDRITLKVSGVDLLDHTPIIDIKPYVPYTDAYHHAQSGPFQKAPDLLPVSWKVDHQFLTKDTQRLIEKVIALDPRPGFDRDEVFGISVAGFNVRFKFLSGAFEILEVTLEA
jgi:tRNA (adenine37-N6)-methyltransferase